MPPGYFNNLKAGPFQQPGIDASQATHDLYGVEGVGRQAVNAKLWVQGHNPNTLPAEPCFTQIFAGDPRVLSLELVGAEIYWKALKHEILEVNPPYVNTNYDWLTYEVVLNKPKFRKTNQSRKVGLYAVEIADMQLWVQDGLRPQSFTAICAAFFPDHTEAEVALLSRRSWWWKVQPDVASLSAGAAPYRKLGTAVEAPADDNPALEPVSLENRKGEVLAGSRNGLRIHIPRYAVLPYNHWDNRNDSRALGTQTTDWPRAMAMIQVNDGADPNDAQCWDMWRTASRSCVLRVNRVKNAGDPWPDDEWQPWNFTYMGYVERDKFRNADPAPDAPQYKNTEFKAEVQKGGLFHLPNRTEDYFSMKTGVAFVGVEDQPNKDTIGYEGEWLIGVLRSDYIKDVQRLAAARGALRADIVVQTEIMFLLERRMTCAALQDIVGVDGVALRDLSVLDPAKVYFTPISIGFVGADMRTLTQEFANIDDPAWCAFWQQNWAEAIGKGKALFLLQYGLQHANPNVQNSLLEFSPGNPPVGPARVVIRDLADALVAREIVWALFGPDQACPQDEAAGAIVGQLSLPVLRYNYRSAAQATGNETASTDSKFGTRGIQFLWTRFSAFYTSFKPAKLAELQPPMRGKVLRRMAVWLVAHSASYVRTVERALGVEFGAVAWDVLLGPLHDPDRYLPYVGADLRADTSQGAADIAWEETAAKVIHDYLANDGRAKICAYHNRAWVEATAAFEIRLVTALGAPMPLTVIFYDSNDHTMTGQRITDAEGKAPFYSKTAADFTFEAGARVYTAGTGTFTLQRVALVTGATAVNVTTLQAPANQRVVTVADPGPIAGIAANVAATVTADKAIKCVQFLLDANDVGFLANAGPYSTTIDTTAFGNGPHNLTAVATDAAGASITSAAVPVIINNPAPTVAITAPADGSTISGANVQITANAAPGADMTLASVRFQLDLVDLVTVGAPGPYAATTNLASGNYTLTAIAKDTAGNETTARITVTV